MIIGVRLSPMLAKVQEEDFSKCYFNFNSDTFAKNNERKSNKIIKKITFLTSWLLFDT